MIQLYYNGDAHQTDTDDWVAADIGKALQSFIYGSASGEPLQLGNTTLRILVVKQ